MKPKYSIIIPTRNEEEGIAKVICSIPDEIRKLSEVIVADSSNDLTPIIAERLGAKVIRVRKGKGRAMKKAVKISKGEILIFLDGDGTDPPTYIPRLLRKLESSQLVLGCRSTKRFKSDDPFLYAVYRMYAAFVRPLFNIVGFKVSDPLAGFRVIRKSDWKKLNLQSNGFEIEAEMNVKAVQHGFIVKEVAIPHLRRSGGLRKSKLAGNPSQWFKILNCVMGYVKEEKIKKRLQKFAADLRKKVRKLVR